MNEAIALILANIQAASAGLIPILYTLLIGAGLDTLSGSWAAWVSGTFDSKFLPEFITSHVVKKITPIFLVLLAGVSVGGIGTPAGIALVTLGGGAGAAYLESVLASIKNNITEGRAGTKGVPSSVETVVISNQPLTDNAGDDEV